MQQTCLDLLERGVSVHVVADACSSRTQVDRLFAFEVRERKKGGREGGRGAINMCYIIAHETKWCLHFYKRVNHF